jgi:curli biogenesis system outer membrane secretion channel CsgG
VERAPEPAKQDPEPKPEPVSVAPARPAGQRLNVAIADLSAQGVSASDAAVMADLLRSEMVKTGQFNVVEKQNMDKVLAEHAFQQTGCTSEECAVKLGKLLNVQRMVVGSFGKLLDSYFLNVRVVDVETGGVVFGDSVEGSRVGDLKAGVKDLAGKLARQIR